MIHPTAIIHPDAKLHPTVQVGPYAVIDGAVELGDGCIVGPHVHLTGVTSVGANNRFHAGCVIGDAPGGYGGTAPAKTPSVRLHRASISFQSKPALAIAQ